MKKLLVLAILLGSGLNIARPQGWGGMNLGIGAGLDYGGFGGQISYLPVKRMALFGGVGYNLAGAGFNLGARLIITNEKRVEWHFAGMYGYNAVLRVEGNSQSNTIYYGPSIGAGITLKSKKKSGTYWNFEVLLPFRPAVFHNTVDDLNQLGYEVTEPLPVTVSVGYHFNLLNF
jgi:hypothetical protein